MRPLRLLFSLATTLLALTLLLYMILGSHTPEESRKIPSSNPTPARKSRIKALFSFTSPASLFPPSAIISLTDENSTFFLARPAAFGPMLPTQGLSGPLWIGSGFGDEAMGKGELGCSDVPGWDTGNAATSRKVSKGSRNTSKLSHREGPAPRTEDGQGEHSSDGAGPLDETDDHLHLAKDVQTRRSSSPEHADIQSLQESAEIAGKVVLLKRGGCGFLEKVMWAQRRGGVALIVGDDIRGGALIRMYAHGDTSNVSIPAIFTSHTTAHLLSSLLPAGDYLGSLSLEELATIKRIKKVKDSKKTTAASDHHNVRPTLTSSAVASKGTALVEAIDKQKEDMQGSNWFLSLLQTFGLGTTDRSNPENDSRRPPSSGNLDWTAADNSLRATSTGTKQAHVSTPIPGDFIIGEQDWRDSALLPQPSSSALQTEISDEEVGNKDPGIGKTGSDHILPSSGEYHQNTRVTNPKQEDTNTKDKITGWLNSWTDGEGSDGDQELDSGRPTLHESAPPSPTKTSIPQSSSDDADMTPILESHEGLWVTLTPTNMSTSPLFDTLLVLVVSPLVTLTVVYALLLLRSRIRRRRWRAPKSVVDRLPVRTYHTISDTPSPEATPATTSPTTPLLQRAPSRPTSAISQTHSRSASDEPATSSSVRPDDDAREEEKRQAGLAQWRRRYGGRQKECVVCLDEYIDGVSKVMSLPCGHEFHADCITPWLVTRRRTCPICKGDVVRSLSQSYRDRNFHSSSPIRSPQIFQNDPGAVQAQAAETRNDSPAASRPILVGSNSDLYEDIDADVEANWDDDENASNDGRGRAVPRDEDRGFGLSGSVRELSSTVQTTIWRGYDAIRSATGLQRRTSPDDIDRDR